MPSLSLQLKKIFYSNHPNFVNKHLTVFLSNEVANATSRLVASFGSSKKPHEGIVYWAGVSTASCWIIITAIAPEAKTTPGSYHTTVASNAYAVRAVNDLKLTILAQVHGHPTDWVDHSEGDNAGAFMPYDGFLSLILPWYGLQGMLPIEKCGVHQFEDGRFFRLETKDIKQRFIVVPSSIDLRRKLISS